MRKVVYALFIYPKISETFILNEMLAMRRKGLEIAVFALEKGTEPERHAGVEAIEEVCYFRRRSGIVKAWSAHFYWLMRHPLRYLALWRRVFVDGCGIRKYFLTQLYNFVLLDRMRPDHVHAHFGQDPAGVALLYHLLSGTPYTFTTHAQDIFDFPPDNFPIKTRLAKRHITISEYNKRYLIERFGLDPGRISIVHCGVDFKTLPAPAGVSKSEPPVILTVARLHREKGLDVLLHALADLKGEGFLFRSVIIGEGSERDTLQAQIRQSGLAACVELLGNRTHDQVLQWFIRARLFVLPSRLEGIPVSLMEAMALRVPVISTNVRGIPELVDNGRSGYLVDPEDAPALGHRIRELLTNEDMRNQFTESAHRKVREQFNLNTETDRLFEIWRAA